jgi:hypothetical protein
MRAAHQVAIGHRFMHFHLCISTAGVLHFRRASGVRAHSLTLDDPRRSQYLRSMAKCGNRFLRLFKMLHQLDHPGVQPQVLGSAPARNHQAIILIRIDIGKRCVQDEVMSSFFRVCLVALEIVNGSPDKITRCLVGADRVHFMAKHL